MSSRDFYGSHTVMGLSNAAVRTIIKLIDKA